MKSRYQIEGKLRTSDVFSKERIMIANYLLRDTRDDNVLFEESINIKIPEGDTRTDDEILQSGILESIFMGALESVIQDGLALGDSDFKKKENI